MLANRYFTSLLLQVRVASARARVCDVPSILSIDAHVGVSLDQDGSK